MRGAKWFHYTLVYADNSLMWQNAGRSGIDHGTLSCHPLPLLRMPAANIRRSCVPSYQSYQKPYYTPTRALGSSSTSATCCRCGLGRDVPHTYIISDLKAERSKSVEAVLKMRRANHGSTITVTVGAYDMITLPDGKRTVAFTKKDIRIDSPI